jgi:hypothetical protein
MGIRPVPEQFPITQTYYANATQYNLGVSHGAVGFGVPLGTDVVSIADGIVWFADWAWNLPGGADDWPVRLYQIKPAAGDTKTGGGILTIVEHDDVFALYAHLRKTSWNKGRSIRQAEVLGESGTTGSSTGPHLHLATIPKPANWGNGYFGHVDPMPYIAEQYRKLVAGAPADTSGASMNGIDASNWQDGINLSAVPADFIGVLATDGKSFNSPTLDAQFTAAQRKTKRTMVYHFARAGQSDSDTQASTSSRRPRSTSRPEPSLSWTGKRTPTTATPSGPSTGSSTSRRPQGSRSGSTRGKTPQRTPAGACSVGPCGSPATPPRLR